MLPNIYSNTKRRNDATMQQKSYQFSRNFRSPNLELKSNKSVSKENMYSPTVFLKTLDTTQDESSKKLSEKKVNFQAKEQNFEENDVQLNEVLVVEKQIYQSPLFGYSEADKKREIIAYEYRKYIKKQILRSSRSSSPNLEKKYFEFI